MSNYLNVGLIGWFGVGAFSDDMINLTTQEIFNQLRKNILIEPRVMWRCQKGGKTDVDYLNSFDLLILCGGSLLGKCTFAPINDIQTWANKLTTPLCIFGTAYRYEPREEPLSEERRHRMNLLFDLAQVIILRGQNSVYWCEKNQIDTSKVEALGDPLLAWPFQTPTQLRRVIGGNVRNMPTNEVQDTSNGYVQKKMAAFYDWLIEETGLPLELYCFRNEPTDSDLAGAGNTLAQMKHKKGVKTLLFRSALQAFTSIDVSFWFGQRLHPSIYAASVGIPFVGVETQFQKQWDFMTSIISKNFIRVSEGIDSLSAKFNLVMKQDYMKHVSIQVKKARENIRAAAKKMLEIGDKR